MMTKPQKLLKYSISNLKNENERNSIFSKVNIGKTAEKFIT